MSSYTWKEASRIKCSAQDAGKLFERLERTVGLTPQTVLEAAKDEKSPIHNEFEWNDDAAAEKYRLFQAGRLIRCLCVRVESEQKPPVRALFNVCGGKYENVQVVLKSKDKRALLLEQALKELKAFERKYSQLEELAAVFEEIEKIEEDKTE